MSAAVRTLNRNVVETYEAHAMRGKEHLFAAASDDELFDGAGRICALDPVGPKLRDVLAPTDVAAMFGHVAMRLRAAEPMDYHAQHCMGALFEAAGVFAPHEKWRRVEAEAVRIRRRACRLNNIPTCGANYGYNDDVMRTCIYVAVVGTDPNENLTRFAEALRLAFGMVAVRGMYRRGDVEDAFQPGAGRHAEEDAIAILSAAVYARRAEKEK